MSREDQPRLYTPDPVAVGRRAPRYALLSNDPADAGKALDAHTGQPLDLAGGGGLAAITGVVEGPLTIAADPTFAPVDLGVAVDITPGWWAMLIVCEGKNVNAGETPGSASLSADGATSSAYSGINSGDAWAKGHGSGWEVAFVGAADVQRIVAFPDPDFDVMFRNVRYAIYSLLGFE